MWFMGFRLLIVPPGESIQALIGEQGTFEALPHNIIQLTLPEGTHREPFILPDLIQHSQPTMRDWLLVLPDETVLGELEIIWQDISLSMLYDPALIVMSREQLV